MSEELEIQVLANSERFNEKKQELKAFSEEIPEQSDLPTVPTDDPMLGFIGMEYDVKGKDLIDVLKKHHKKLEELEQLEDKQSEIHIEIDSLKAKLKSLVKIENSFNDLHLQVEETQNNLKNDVDKMNVRLIEEGKNLTLIVEKFQTELEEKQKEISFLRKGFYTIGVAVVIIVLFLLFKGM